MAGPSLYFATNRRPIEKDGVVMDFNGEPNPLGAHRVMFGVAQVEGGKVLSQKALPDDVSMFSIVKDKALTGRGILIGVHGFNTGHEQAITGFHKTKCAFEDAKLNMIGFSWPSDGSPLKYFSDRDDAKRSGEALGRLVMKGAEFLATDERGSCGQQVDLVCHSMGNWVLENAVQFAIGQMKGMPLPRIFKNVFLMAADVDANVFEHDTALKRLPEMAENVHIFVSRHDKALKGSDLAKHNPQRLGYDGPTKPHELPRGVNIVDCSRLDRLFKDIMGHGYFDERPQAIEVVNHLLMGKPIHEMPESRLKWIPAQHRYEVQP